MLNTILMMYITLMPPILSGIANMAWCKSNLLKVAMIPIDGGKNLSDGRRIFGDNKTWKGFLGYLILNMIFSLLWGSVCYVGGFEHLNFFYVNHDNTACFNLLIGMLLGMGYALFELPNSFIKRRLDIKPGKSPSGFWKVFFVFLDQADSVFGCALVVWIFYNFGIRIYLFLP